MAINQTNLTKEEKRKETIARKQREQKEQIRANLNRPKKKVRGTSTLKFEVRELADEYEDAYEDYTGKRKQFFKATIKEGTKSFELLARGVSFARELKVDLKTYIKALFWIEDSWHNRCLSTRMISDYKTNTPAKERVQIYLGKVKDGDAKVEKKVVGPVSATPTIPQAHKDRNSERNLQRFMKNYGISAEEVFLKFGRPEIASSYFDRKWLKTHPVYVQLRAEQKI